MRRYRFASLLFLGMFFTFSSHADVSPKNSAIAENHNRTSAGTLENGTLAVRLELRSGLWDPDGREHPIEVPAMAEEGRTLQSPAPMLRVPQGTEIHASVHNLLSSDVFVHGLHQHPGKPEDTIQVAAGETKNVSFLAGEPGTYLYWAAGSKESTLADGAMAGAFIVDAPGASVNDRVFVLQEWARNFFQPSFDATLTMNGKAWPYTERLQAQVGEAEHWRVLNATALEHPMHLHGFFFHVDSAGDGESDQHFSEAERRLVVTERVVGGHTFTMSWIPDRAGNWIFHCHIMDHVVKGYLPDYIYGPNGKPAELQHIHGENESMGMTGLVMGIQVSDSKAHLVPAKAAVAPVAAERNLYVRERKPDAHTPAGAGFYLEGVSKEVGAIGPPLVITRGERTAIHVHNELTEPTSIHWHGIELESYYDGVAQWGGTAQNTTPFIQPGSTFDAFMTPPRAGTFIYHTHYHNVKQLTGGMYGALLVLEPGQTYDPATDKVFVLGRSGPNELTDPMVLNGSAQPCLMVVLSEKKYRFRFVNMTTNDAHVEISLRLNGQPVKWRAVGKDGADLPAQQATDRDAVQVISVGETYDFEFAPKELADYELRFYSDFGNVVTQIVTVVPSESPFSVFAQKR